MKEFPELIKNIEHLRGLVREFFVFGFKTRNSYDKKSKRTYDLEKSRIESYFDEFFEGRKNRQGKQVSISIDSGTVTQNPIYRLYGAKSFTKNDLILHFLVLDVFQEVKAATAREFADYVSLHYTIPAIDSATMRIKLNEYAELGILTSKQRGNKLVYSLCPCFEEQQVDWRMIEFFSETDILGVVGSFILSQRIDCDSISPIMYKHHFLFGALDSHIILEVLKGIAEKAVVRITNKAAVGLEVRNVVPLKIMVNRQNGRRYLAAYDYDECIFLTFRLDYIQKIEPVEIGIDTEKFDYLQRYLKERLEYTWNVNYHKESLTEVCLTLKIEEDEKFVYNRLVREGRKGEISKIGADRYQYRIKVYDPTEMFPWLKSFIGRIIKLEISDPEIQARFYEDFKKLTEVCNGNGIIS